jgi:hypothetical protein
MVPIFIDENSVVLKGHATLEAAKLLKMQKVPTVTWSGLSEAQKRAFMIADNRVAQDAGWDYEILVNEFDELAELLRPIDLDLTITGFEPAEIDSVFADRGVSKSDPGDAAPAIPKKIVSRPGDVWSLRGHRILCGDARSSLDLDILMAGRLARVIRSPLQCPDCGSCPRPRAHKTSRIPLGVGRDGRRRVH